MSSFSSSRLRQARESMAPMEGRPVSRETFAGLLGVSLRTAQRWESGVTNPRAAVLLRIAQITGRPLEFFFSDDEVAA